MRARGGYRPTPVPNEMLELAAFAMRAEEHCGGLADCYQQALAKGQLDLVAELESLAPTVEQFRIAAGAIAVEFRGAHKRLTEKLWASAAG